MRIDGLKRGPHTALWLLAACNFALVGCSEESLASNDTENVGEVGQAAFDNGNFEAGLPALSPDDWTVTSFWNPGVTYPPQTLGDLHLQPGGSLNTTKWEGAQESQIDPALGAGASLRWPKYGTGVAVLNPGTGTNTNSMKQIMTIGAADVDPADSKVHVRFTVAPVLQNPGHDPASQPYYFVELRNLTRGTVLYHDYNASAAPGIPWKVSNGVYYTDWQLVDIAPGSAALALGDSVELEVIAAGCSAGGHYGRVYVDGVGATVPGLFVSAVGPASANAGSNITYTLNYRNGGTGGATNSVVEITTPPDTTFQSVSATGCTTPAVGGTGTVYCPVGAIAVDASGSFQVTVGIDPGATGTITNGTYQISATGVSPLLGSKVNTLITENVAYADVDVSVTNSAAGLGWGQATSYSIVVHNSGPSAVSGLTVNDPLPTELSNASWTCVGSDGGTCAASGTGSIADSSVSLPSGASVTYTLNASVIAGSGAGSVSNTVSTVMPAGTSDSDPSDNAAGDTDAIGELHVLALTKLGAGTVTSIPSALNCAVGCASDTAAFIEGSVVVLVATPAVGESFLGWTGAPQCGLLPLCTVTVAADLAISASFSTPGSPIAASCDVDGDCASGHCIDDLCCATSCGNGVANDCQACNLQGSEGTCTPMAASTLCRAASCDEGIETVGAVCDGSSSQCPAVDTNECGAYECGSDACETSCDVHDGCTGTSYCEDGGCNPFVDPGVECTADYQCGTGHCTDGVCCESACLGQCEACDQEGHEGECVAVSGEPVGERDACDTDGGVCGGQCDGEERQQCAYPTAAISCRDADCAEGVATLQASCDGDGACMPLMTQECGQYACGKEMCLGDCHVDGDCASGNHCQAGICEIDQIDGKVCSRDGECGSGECVDGICCDTACEGQCEACNLPGDEGTCSPAVGRPVGERDACESDGSNCAGECDGKLRDRCAYPDAEVDCREPSCTDGIAITAGVCQGNGSCQIEQKFSCGNFDCGETKCEGNCEGDSQCADNAFCAAGVCTPKLELAVACNDDDECATGHCADGVCCGTACVGQCEACNLEGSEGSCDPVSGQPRGDRAACESDGSACAGTCDGTKREACAYPSDEVLCGHDSCADGVATLKTHCDFKGSCVEAEKQSCGQYQCGESLCAGDCSVNADCADDSFCNGGLCVKQRAIGSECSVDAQCGSGVCADGVCCGTACDGACEACDIEGSEGQCIAVQGEPRPGSKGCAGDEACGGFCDGHHPECVFPAAGSECGESQCEGEAVVSAPTCDGAGECVDHGSVVCAPGTRCEDGGCQIPEDMGLPSEGGASEGGSSSSGGSSEGGSSNSSSDDDGETNIGGGQVFNCNASPTSTSSGTAALGVFATLALAFARRRRDAKRAAR